jgi:hypothetical protein
MHKNRELKLILALYLILGAAFGVVVPPFENLDEIEHFEVIRYVADTGRLPVHDSLEARGYRFRQEASQPPLYHLVSAGIVRLLNLSTEDIDTFGRPYPLAACGPGGANLYYNRMAFAHSPELEAFPWKGTILTVHVLRLWSTALQAFTLLGTFALARAAFPKHRSVALLATAFTGFNPQFLLVSSGVNNDNLVTPLVTWALYLLIRSWKEGLSLQRSTALGVLAGLAGLSKLSGWLLVPLAGLLVLMMPRRTGRRFGNQALTASLIPAVALLAGGWWLYRNITLYGDPTALKPMLEIVGRQQSAASPVGRAWIMFRSYWGQIPCSFYPQSFYVFYTIVCAAAALGLVLAWRELTREQRAHSLIISGWALIIIVSWARWDALTPAPGGRLLFPAISALSTLAGLGVHRMVRTSDIGGARLVVALLGAAAILTVAAILPSFFLPPTRYVEEQAPEPGHALTARFGDNIAFHGYDLAQRQGDRLDVTLYWQVLQPLDQDYILAIQLVSPVPGDNTMRLNYNAWPGHGTYRTSAWQPDQVVADEYSLHLPSAIQPTQGWNLQVTLYEEDSGNRLPVARDDMPLGDHLRLAAIRVPGEVVTCPDDARLPQEVVFGDIVSLTHSVVEPTDDRMTVLLCWQALGAPQRDYTVFVHLSGESGELLATGDGPPMHNAFPTSLWQTGDVVVDLHSLGPVPPGASKTITVGLYDPVSGTRLLARQDHHLLPEAAAEIWPNPQ